jgi:hypothetical protein
MTQWRSDIPVTGSAAIPKDSKGFQTTNTAYTNRHQAADSSFQSPGVELSMAGQVFAMDSGRETLL